MGKNDFLTPKAIANRIKSKGLQKLRWYCQMCQKQCRDENGFKCHLTSESHKRQMMVFGENPDRVIDGYSEEFESSFLEHLRRNHPSTRVAAQGLYNEFIADKHHIHMNSTKWLTLTDFVKYLGRTGKCKVDQTEKGWHLVYIKKDIEEELQEERRAKRHKAEKFASMRQEEEDRQRDYLEAQIERARRSVGQEEGPAQGTELQRDVSGGATLQMALPNPKTRLSQVSFSAPKGRPSAAFQEDDSTDIFESAGQQAPQRPKTKQEEIMEREKADKKQIAEQEAAAKAAEAKKHGRKDEPWLHVGVVVKVMSKELKAHGYFKEKGVVEKLFNKYVAQITMLKSGDVLQVDQAQLETVLPSLGGELRVLKGVHKGCRATLQAIDAEKFQAKVRLKSGDTLWMEYEDICKISTN